jgi:hypothetical protein
MQTKRKQTWYEWGNKNINTLYSYYREIVYIVSYLIKEESIH